MKRGPYLSKETLKKGIAHFKYSEERDLRSLEIPSTLTFILPHPLPVENITRIIYIMLENIQIKRKIRKILIFFFNSEQCAYVPQVERWDNLIMLMSHNKTIVEEFN